CSPNEVRTYFAGNGSSPSNEAADRRGLRDRCSRPFEAPRLQVDDENHYHYRFADRFEGRPTKGRGKGMSSAARHAMAVVIFALVVALAGCSSVGSAAAGGRASVVAAENFWGSIACQLGGARVDVMSVVDNPN